MAATFSPEMIEFLRQPRVACIATLNHDGSPHLSYVWYEFDGKVFRISTTDDRVKGRNVARDNRVALSLLDPANPYRWLSVNGRATITREGANDLIMALTLRYMGPEAQEQGRQMQGPNRIVVTLTPESVIALGF